MGRLVWWCAPEKFSPSYQARHSVISFYRTWITCYEPPNSVITIDTSHSTVKLQKSGKSGIEYVGLMSIMSLMPNNTIVKHIVFPWIIYYFKLLLSQDFFFFLMSLFLVHVKCMTHKLYLWPTVCRFPRPYIVTFTPMTKKGNCFLLCIIM